MFKKLVIASAVLAVTTNVALAHAYKGDYKGEAMPAPCPVYNPVVAPYIGLSLAHRLNYGSFRADSELPVILSLGYGGIVSPNWYLAGEIYGDYGINLKDFSSHALSARSTWDWGVSVLPGYMITDHVLAYARVGYQGTRFSNQGTSKGAWQVGLGAQTNIYQNWDLRAEYSYARYGSISSIGKVNANQATVGVIYRFV